MITTLPHKIVSPSQPNFSHPLNRGLVGWWLAWPGYNGYGSDKWLDISGKGNHGTLTNMDPGTDWIGDSIRNGGSLDFDGTDAAGRDICDLATINLGEVYSITVVAKTLTQVGGSLNMIVTTGTNWNDGIILNWDGVDQYEYFPYSAASSRVKHTADSSLVGRWSVVSCVKNGDDCKLYLNGRLGGSGTISGTSTYSTLKFGSGSPFIYSWTGRLGSVMFHNRNLDAAEVARLYHESIQGYPNLLAPIRYPLPVSTAAAAAGPNMLTLLGVG